MFNSQTIMFPLTSPEQHKFPLGEIETAVVSNLC